MRPLKHRIVQSLLEQPGQTDADLADNLNESRKLINRTLYLELSAETRRDDNLLWYALSEAERSEILSSLVARTTFDHLRGQNLFNVEASNKKLQMHLNVDHRFFQDDFQSLDEQGQQTVLRLLETLGVAMSHRFQNQALLDELIAEWSAVLARRVEFEQALTAG